MTDYTTRACMCTHSLDVQSWTTQVFMGIPCEVAHVSECVPLEWHTHLYKSVSDLSFKTIEVFRDDGNMCVITNNCKPPWRFPWDVSGRHGTKRYFQLSGLEGIEEQNGEQEGLVCGLGQTQLPVSLAFQWRRIRIPGNQSSVLPWNLL